MLGAGGVDLPRQLGKHTHARACSAAVPFGSIGQGAGPVRYHIAPHITHSDDHLLGLCVWLGSLYGANIGDAGAKEVAAVLKTNSTLIRLE